MNSGGMYWCMMINRRGQALIEVIAAVMVVAIALAAITASLMNSYKAAVLNQEYTQALILLESHIQHAFLKSSPSLQSMRKPNNKPWERFENTQQIIEKPIAEDSLLDKVALGVVWPSGRHERSMVVTAFLEAGESGAAAK